MPDRTDEFINQLVADLRPVRPLRQAGGMAMTVAALLAGMLGVAGLFGLRPDVVAGQPGPMLLVPAGLFLVLALASAWCAVDMARPQVGLRREGWGWTALMAAVLPASAFVLAAGEWLAGRDVALDRAGWTCVAGGIMFGLATAVVLIVWLRRGAPTALARAGLLTGVAAGAAGTLAVSLECPQDGLLHIGLWHGGAVILCGLIGRVIVPRLIRW